MSHLKKVFEGFFLLTYQILLDPFVVSLQTYAKFKRKCTLREKIKSWAASSGLSPGSRWGGSRSYFYKEDWPRRSKGWPVLLILYHNSMRLTQLHWTMLRFLLTISLTMQYTVHTLAINWAVSKKKSNTWLSMSDRVRQSRTNPQRRFWKDMWPEVFIANSQEFQDHHLGDAGYCMQTHPYLRFICHPVFAHLLFPGSKLDKLVMFTYMKSGYD